MGRGGMKGIPMETSLTLQFGGDHWQLQHGGESNCPRPKRSDINRLFYDDDIVDLVCKM